MAKNVRLLFSLLLATRFADANHVTNAHHVTNSEHVTNVHHVTALRCPLGSRFVDDLEGCGVCACCRFANSDRLHVSCTQLDLATVPEQLPRETTDLLLDGNHITHLYSNSFPELPNLETLNLLSNPLEVIENGTFRPVSNLRNLTLFIDNWSRSNRIALRGLVNLKALSLQCGQPFSAKIQEEVFKNWPVQSIVTGSNCGLLLDERLFNRTVKLSQVKSFGNPKYVNMPTTPVSIQVDQVLNSTDECLGFENVMGSQLSVQCSRVVYLDITRASFSKLAENVTELQVNVTGVRGGRIESLGDVRIDKLLLSAQTLNASWLNDLGRALNTSTIRSLSVSSKLHETYGTVGTAFFDQLQNTGLRELSIANIRVDNITPQMIGKLNLTVLECHQCELDSFPIAVVRRQPNLQILRLSMNERFLVNLTEVLHVLPDLRLLNLSSQRSLEIVGGLGSLRHRTLTNLTLNDNRPILNSWSSANFSALVDLRYLDLSGCAWGEYPLERLVVRNLARLETLNFDRNGASATVDPGGVLQGLARLTKLSLKNNALYKMSSEQMRRFLRPVAKTLTYFSIARNNIQYLTKAMFSNMEQIQFLNIGYNRLKTIHSDLFQHTVHVTSIALYGNLIETFNVGTFRNLPYLRRLYFTFNQFRCDCDLVEFRQWAKKELLAGRLRVLGAAEEICYTPSELKYDKVRVFDYEMAWIACDQHLEMVVASVCGFLALVLVGLVVCAYRYRYDLIFWWVITRARHRRGARGSGYQRVYTDEERFHAFLSYSSADTQIAIQVVTTLESGDDIKFKIAFDVRDFEPGRFITDNIVSLIERSEKLIFLISRRFLASEWALYELRMGELKCFEEKKNLMILIFVEDIPRRELPRSLRTLARHVNYLQWPVAESDVRGRAVFWKRLKLGLNKVEQ